MGKQQFWNRMVIFKVRSEQSFSSAVVPLKALSVLCTVLCCRQRHAFQFFSKGEVLGWVGRGALYN